LRGEVGDDCEGRKGSKESRGGETASKQLGFGYRRGRKGGCKMTVKKEILVLSSPVEPGRTVHTLMQNYNRRHTDVIYNPSL